MPRWAYPRVFVTHRLAGERGYRMSVRRPFLSRAAVSVALASTLALVVLLGALDLAPFMSPPVATAAAVGTVVGHPARLVSGLLNDDLYFATAIGPTSWKQVVPVIAMYTRNLDNAGSGEMTLVAVSATGSAKRENGSLVAVVGGQDYCTYQEDGSSASVHDPPAYAVKLGVETGRPENSFGDASIGT